MADVRTLTTAYAELLGRSFATGTEIRREHLQFVRDQAARRVHQGVSLETFLHAYRVALFEYWDACADEASRLGLSRDAGFALARVAHDAMDTISTHAAEAYLREETRVRAQSGRAARDLVERLIRGQPVADGRHPGLDPAGRLVTIVGRVEETALAVGEALQLARDALEQTLSLGRARPLVVIRQGEIVAVTSSRATLARAREQVLGEHGVDVRYGVSAPAPGFGGVQQAYREATLSLTYASAARPIASLEELSALEVALIGASATTRAVIASKGRELAGEDRDTIRAFSAADLNVARAARLMQVHPNTVRYRLERIATTTGSDPRTFAGLVELVCALEVEG
jgi:hypothetical protein